MDKVEVNPEDYEIVKIERKDGIFSNPETGVEIPYKNYYVHFRNINNPLVIRAKVDKVFNDYVENTY